MILQFLQRAHTLDNLVRLRVTEKEITAYVAEMCSHERYNRAIDTVPSSFKQGNKRTFLSVPYFAGLVAMDETLVSHNQRL